MRLPWGKGEITIKTELNEQFIELTISDTGFGIKQDTLPKITEPFFTTKDPGEGTGLGLSITYSIIKEHDGELEFDSIEDKGTTVTIRLPVENTNNK